MPENHVRTLSPTVFCAIFVNEVIVVSQIDFGASPNIAWAIRVAVSFCTINASFFFIVKVFSVLAEYKIFHSVFASVVFVTLTFMRNIDSRRIKPARERFAQRVSQIFWPLAFVCFPIIKLFVRTNFNLGVSIFAFTILAAIFVGQRGIG